MATKKNRPATKKKSVRPKKRKPVKAEVIDHEEAHLEALISASERAVTGDGSSIDSLFIQQAKRLRKALAELVKVKS